ncbi:hypothetical protein GCM10023093_31890 [Nemorincola caseinilytica]|uniref:T9SS type A sorting domain-containing protein n=1 Tax=Nemorincola caseinilytica TaxID=2054315 RepID=A0ABP8NPZ4_9BACT
MRKNYLYLAFAMSLLAGRTYAQHAQPCATDEMHHHYQKMNPLVAEYEKELNEQIAAYIASKGRTRNVAAKGTEGGSVHHDTDYYDIPVVVHIMHSFGGEYVKDSNIYVMMDNLNKFYSKQNDLSGIIQPFKKYIGNAKIRFHLATKDPEGKPTKGITRRLTYLTYGGDDQAKIDLWPPRNYFNIWIENRIGLTPTAGTTLAYSTFPASAEAYPFSDGVIAAFSYINDKNTMEHEVGHYFNLQHTWSSSLAGPGEACGDDGVDDTPPTKGNFSTCPLYDTNCATNYYKIYVSASGFADSLVNYPDTANVQNVMNYSSCPNIMLSEGQIWRMRAALNSNIGGRNNLWDSTNLSITGAGDPLPDLPPVTEFVTRASAASNVITLFTFPGVPLFFTNKSWRDTVIKTEWSFTNGAATPNVTHNSYAAINGAFGNTFADPGWVNINLAASGNNSGTTSTMYEKAVFVSDLQGIDPLTGYLEDFQEGGKRDKWPYFNYYKNNMKWQQGNVGVYDNNCIMYQGFDTRTGMEQTTGTPVGDFDDLYSIAYDLSKFAGSGKCFMHFNYTGASRSTLNTNINDTLVIEYSTDKKHVWLPLATMAKAELCNKGAIATAYTPDGIDDWASKSISIPTAARTSYVVFRFRYKPGVNKTTLQSTGNNFYMDRIQITPWAADVNDVNMASTEVRVVPNPTQGDAWVVIKDAAATEASIVVTDITGKVVYKAQQALTGTTARIMIPAQAIGTPGMYLVQTLTGSQVSTQKLVVY